MTTQPMRASAYAVGSTLVEPGYEPHGPATMAHGAISAVVRANALRWIGQGRNEAVWSRFTPSGDGIESLMRPTGLAVQPGEDVPGTVSSIDERGGMLPSDTDRAMTDAAERPWTDATKLGHRDLNGGYRFLGTVTVTTNEATWTQLAPSARLAKRGHDGPSGDQYGGTWKVRTDLAGRLQAGHAGQSRKRAPGRKRKDARHGTNADRQRAYRQRIKDEAAARGITQAQLKRERAAAMTERTNEWQ